MVMNPSRGRVKVRMFARERQRGGIDRVREICPVAGVAGEIDGAAQNQHQRDGGCPEQHEDVAAVVVAKRRNA